jgi:hypothetical protein
LSWADPEEPRDAWALRTRDYMYAQMTGTGELEVYDLASA